MSCHHSHGRLRIVVEELSGVRERAMIVGRVDHVPPQQPYDHRLRDLVQRTGDLTIATDLGVPHSTARGWLRAAPAVVVSVEMTDLTEAERRQEIMKLQRRVENSRRCSGWRWPFYTPRVQAVRKAAAGGTSQTADPARRRSGAHLCSVASGPSVPACVAQPVSGGADDRLRVRSTIGRRVLVRHPID